MRKLTGMILSTAVLVSSVSFSAAYAADTAKPAIEMKQVNKETQKAAITSTAATEVKPTQIAAPVKEEAKAVTTTAVKPQVKTAVKAVAKTEVKSEAVDHKTVAKDTQAKKTS